MSAADHICISGNWTPLKLERHAYLLQDEEEADPQWGHFEFSALFSYLFCKSKKTLSSTGSILRKIFLKAEAPLPRHFKANSELSVFRRGIILSFPSSWCAAFANFEQLHFLFYHHHC